MNDLLAATGSIVLEPINETIDGIYFFNRSKDGGNTFSDPALLSSVSEFEEFPRIAITLNGILIVGWITQPPRISEFNIRTSQDGGTTTCRCRNSQEHQLLRAEMHYRRSIR
ncbi:hypothetical protein ACWGPW_03850 [Paenibacillus chitinolyticus]